MKPTEAAYAELQLAYDHFNRALFADQLPPCLLTIERKKRTYGYFSSNRFEHAVSGAKTDQITLNPEYFRGDSVLEVMQTVVHEMCHLWQYHFGKPGRARYHNKEWGTKMKSIGLMPSSTGKPGGKEVGDCMADYPIEGGAFLSATDDLVRGRKFKISWLDSAGIALAEDEDGAGEGGGDTGAETKQTRQRFQCPCGQKAWGKKSLQVVCKKCKGDFAPA